MGCRSFIMSFALDYFDSAVGNSVYDPIALIDASAPISAEISLQRLGFADAFVSRTRDILQDCINAL